MYAKISAETTSPRHKISDLLDEFQFEINQDDIAREYAFGAGVSIYARVNNPDRMPLPDDFVRTLESKKASRIEEVRDVLRLYLDDQDKLKALNEILSQYPMPDELAGKIVEYMSEDVGIVEGLIMCDEETFIDFCAWNEWYLNSDEAQKWVVIEKVMHEWEQRICAAIESECLPADAGQLTARMNEVKVIFGDPIVLMMKDMGGLYVPADRLIIVSAGCNEKRLEKTLYHELMHHLSGQTVIVNKYSMIDDSVPTEDVHTEVSVTRSGIMGGNRARSINEAITEQLTQLLLTQKDGLDFSRMTILDFFASAIDYEDEDHYPYEEVGTYFNARKQAMNLLLGVARARSKDLEGLSGDELWERSDEIESEIINTVLKAYFEDYLPETPIGERAAARRDLWRLIIDAYGRDSHEVFNKGKDPHTVRRSRNLKNKPQKQDK